MVSHSVWSDSYLTADCFKILINTVHFFYLIFFFFLYASSFHTVPHPPATGLALNHTTATFVSRWRVCGSHWATFGSVIPYYCKQVTLLPRLGLLAEFVTVIVCNIIIHNRYKGSRRTWPCWPELNKPTLSFWLCRAGNVTNQSTDIMEKMFSKYLSKVFRKLDTVLLPAKSYPPYILYFPGSRRSKMCFLQDTWNASFCTTS